MSEIHDLSAAELAEQYRGGSLSPVGVAAAQLDRIEAWEPKLNAMYRLDRDGAAESLAELAAKLNYAGYVEPGSSGLRPHGTQMAELVDEREQRGGAVCGPRLRAAPGEWSARRPIPRGQGAASRAVWAPALTAEFRLP